VSSGNPGSIPGKTFIFAALLNTAASSRNVALLYPLDFVVLLALFDHHTNIHHVIRGSEYNIVLIWSGIGIFALHGL
jgi:hypothetical protein